MDGEIRRHVGVDMLEEAEEFLMAMPRLALAEHLTGGDVQGGEERSCPMSDIVVRDAFDVSEPKGKQGLGALESLRLTLLSTQSTMAWSGGLR